MAKLVTIAWCPNAIEAHVVRSQLATHEIPAFVLGEHEPYLLDAYQVQVRAADLKVAKQVLSETRPD